MFYEGVFWLQAFFTKFWVAISCEKTFLFVGISYGIRMILPGIWRILFFRDWWCLLVQINCEKFVVLQFVSVIFDSKSIIGIFDCAVAIVHPVWEFWE